MTKLKVSSRRKGNKLARVTVKSKGFPGFVTAGSRGTNDVIVALSVPRLSPLLSVGWPLSLFLQINVFHELLEMAIRILVHIAWQLQWKPPCLLLASA